MLIPFARPDAGSLPLPRLRAATYERAGQVVRTFHAGGRHVRYVRCARTVIRLNPTDRPNAKTPGLVREEEAHVVLRASGIGEAHA